MVLSNCNASENGGTLQELIRVIRLHDHHPVVQPALPFASDSAEETRGWLLHNAAPVGYAWLERQTPGRGRIEIGVHPEHRHRGHAARLLGEVVAQAKSWELAELLVSLPAGDSGAAAFAAEFGFTAQSRMTVLVAGAAVEGPAIKIGGDYFLQRFSEFRHLPTLAAVLNRAYQDHFGRPENEHGAVTVESLQTDLVRNPDDEFFLMFDMFGKSVAVIRARADNWIDGPGIVREERGSGLHLPLVASALQHLQNGKARTMTVFQPGSGWTAGYQAFGFKVAAEYDLYIKDV